MKTLFFYLKIMALSLFASCGHLFYYPHEKIYYTPDQFDLVYEQVQFQHNHNHIIQGWLITPQSKRFKKPLGTVLHFHGNAENRSTHFLQLAWMTEYGYQVLTWDYSGYADSQGEAQRDQLYQDSLLVLEETIKRYPGTLIVYGQSLGGNIALPAAVKHQEDIDLLVLDSTFPSYQEIAFDKLKSSWITFVLSPLAYVVVNDDWAASNYLNTYRGAVLVVHGMEDTIVEQKYGQEIFKALPGPKDFLWFEGENHLQAFRKEENRKALLDKMQALIKGQDNGKL